MEPTNIYIESLGDPSVGIQPSHAEVRMFIADDDEREMVRQVLQDAFSQIWDEGGIRILFENPEDEQCCSRCNARKADVPWSVQYPDLCAECESELAQEATYLDHADYMSEGCHDDSGY